jgi:hypothetical protein
MFGAAILVVGTMVVASYVFFPNGEFWEEMASISTDISSIDGGGNEACVRAASGRACGSSSDRLDLAKAGWRVFLRSPLMGVGPGNFGAYAAENFAWGEGSGSYEDPSHLYGRSLHNIYTQVLSEHGLIGIAVFVSILVDFVRRNRRLRTNVSGERWADSTHGKTDLRSVALGLESALVGFLASGLFYDQLYISTFYSIVGLNFVLSCVLARDDGGGSVPGVMDSAQG